MRSITAAFVAMVTLGVATRAQQTPPPVFRSSVEAIEIDAFVTDASGNPVTDLTIGDFDVLEDGVPQTIASLSLVNIPVERGPRPLVPTAAFEPDVFTNDGPEGRLYIVALDEVPASCALRFRHFMRRFLEEQFAPNDVAAIVYVGRGRSIDTQDFTSNRRLLIEAMDRYSGGAGAGSGPGERTIHTRSRMSQLRALLEFAAKLRGRRKTMIYVTRSLGDIDRVLDYNGTALPHELEDLHAAMAAATRGNVSIYPLDPAGLSPGGVLGEEGPGANPSCGELGTRLDDMMDLRSMARATGGFALVNSNSFEEAFARIVRENSTYYVLGFSSTNERRDGRYRRIEVRVKRPGVQVRARDGYVAPLRGAPPSRPAPGSDTLAAPVADALSLPIATGTLPMSVVAAPFKGSGRNARVAVALEIDAGRLGLTRRGETMAGDLQVAVAAVSAAGRVTQGPRHRVALALEPDAWQTARAQGVRVLSQLALPAGRYQLRVAAGNADASHAGSVMADLVVPDFTKEPLAMSGVEVSSSTSNGVTANREFTRGETLSVFAEVYDNRRSRAAYTVTLTIELRTQGGSLIETTSEARSSKELDSRTGGYGFGAHVPLRGAAPGLHVIHVEARANIAGQPAVSRDIPITVK